MHRRVGATAMSISFSSSCIARIPRNGELIGKGERTCARNFLLSRLTESSNDRTLRGRIVTYPDFISSAAYDEKDVNADGIYRFRFKIAGSLHLDSQSSSYVSFQCVPRNLHVSLWHCRKVRLIEVIKKKFPIIKCVILAYDSPPTSFTSVSIFSTFKFTMFS